MLFYLLFLLLKKVENENQTQPALWNTIIIFVPCFLQVGLAFLAGLAFAVLLIPINRQIAIKIGDLSTCMMSQKDARVKVSYDRFQFLIYCSFSRRKKKFILMSFRFLVISIYYLVSVFYLNIKLQSFSKILENKYKNWLQPGFKDISPWLVICLELWRFSSMVTFNSEVSVVCPSVMCLC